MRSREIFTKKCRQQQIFDSVFKGAWHYNHVTFTPIAKNFMLYCRLIYMLSILCVRLTIKVKVGIPESFKVGWYPPPPKKKLGRVTLRFQVSFASPWLQWRNVLIPLRLNLLKACISPLSKEQICLLYATVVSINNDFRRKWTTSGAGKKQKLVSISSQYCERRFHNQGILAIRTHFKPTETFQYTHFSSCNPHGVRKGLIKG